MIFSKSWQRWILVVVAVATVSSVASASAIGNDHNEYIYACADMGNSGKIRLVSTASDCKIGETALSWVSGTPNGIVGPEGPHGVQGDQGPSGAQGPEGAVGPEGTEGPTGPAGLQGETGSQGPQGETGPQGLLGPLGPQGAEGPQGIPGSLLLAGQRCSTNEYVVGFDSNGEIICGGLTGTLTTQYGSSIPLDPAEGTSLSGADLTGVDLSYRMLVEMNFNGSDLTGANLSASIFSGSTFENAVMREINADTANFKVVDFTGADLTGARNMDTAVIVGVTWSGTTCPDGVSSDDAGGTCEGHLIPEFP